MLLSLSPLLIALFVVAGAVAWRIYVLRPGSPRLRRFDPDARP